MPKLIDLTGKKFGRWTVLNRLDDKGNNRVWDCVCDCGKKQDIFGINLTRGLSTSCGCFRSENKNNFKHGLRSSPEFKVWAGIKQRCYNTNDTSYNRYGAIGITMCEEWFNSFENFYKDMGKKPTRDHSIDRIDVLGNYEPSNCRWSDKYTQARNTRDQLREGNGVYKKKDRFYSIIRVEGKNVHLGTFGTKEDAITARKEAELKYWNKSS